MYGTMFLALAGAVLFAVLLGVANLIVTAKQTKQTGSDAGRVAHSSSHVGPEVPA
jgi:putative copper export protein